jgi:hypothetical protein
LAAIALCNGQITRSDVNRLGRPSSVPIKVHIVRSETKVGVYQVLVMEGADRIRRLLHNANNQSEIKMPAVSRKRIPF